MSGYKTLREVLDKYQQDRADAALLRLLEARRNGASPERLYLLRKAYDRAWLAASYVRTPDHG